MGRQKGVGRMTNLEAIAVLESDAEYMYSQDSPYNREAYRMAIEALKAEPKHGRWETCRSGHDAVCTNCRRYWIPVEDKYDYRFCPRCGAYMREVEECQQIQK